MNFDFVTHICQSWKPEFAMKLGKTPNILQESSYILSAKMFSCGMLKKMKQRITIEEVARLAGVSTATVSRVLSRPEVVRDQTREQVMAAIAKLDYQPDAAARALASGRTHTVGCVIPTLDHAIFARSTQAMQTTLAQAGYQLLVASHEYNPVTEFELVRALQQRGVDSLVLVGTDHAPRLWKALSAWRKPTLLTWSCDPRLPSLGFDNEGAAQMAASHLLELGHKCIGVISGLTAHNDRARSRIDGVRKSLTQAGLSLPPTLVTEQAFNLEGGRLGLRKLMASRHKPSAIFCGNDLLAVGALLEAQRMGLHVPNDLSICGIDNLEIAEAINPGLTTVNLPTQDLGRLAAKFMLSTISGEVIATQSLLPFELVIRGSTSSPRDG